jgi:hypothetical protein
MKLPWTVAVVLVLLHCSGCVGSRHYHTLNKGFATSARRFLELRHKAQVATLHFPAGTYVLEAADDRGFFYRAPAKILENSFSGPLFHNGGLYLSNSGRRVLRGYVYWYSGLVHVGELSRADYVLGDF